MILNFIIEIKRFIGYIIFRIYKYGIKMSIGKSEKWDGYFYLLLVISLIPSFIVLKYAEYLTEFNFYKYFETKITLTIAMAFIYFPMMFVISLLIPFKYVKNLTYTPEERVKYRNMFLVLLGVFVLFVLLRIKGFL